MTQQLGLEIIEGKESVSEGKGEGCDKGGELSIYSTDDEGY